MKDILKLQPENKSRILIGIILLFIGIVIFLFGFIRSQINYDQGGTIALIGASIFLAGFGTVTFNYKKEGV